jgi:hypothetical protein
MPVAAVDVNRAPVGSQQLLAKRWISIRIAQPDVSVRAGKRDTQEAIGRGSAVGS